MILAIKYNSIIHLLGFNAAISWAVAVRLFPPCKGFQPQIYAVHILFEFDAVNIVNVIGTWFVLTILFVFYGVRNCWTDVFFARSIYTHTFHSIKVVGIRNYYKSFE